MTEQPFPFCEPALVILVSKDTQLACQVYHLALWCRYIHSVSCCLTNIPIHRVRLTAVHLQVCKIHWGPSFLPRHLACNAAALLDFHFQLLALGLLLALVSRLAVCSWSQLSHLICSLELQELTRLAPPWAGKVSCLLYLCPASEAWDNWPFSSSL